MKKVLITGANSYIGDNIKQYLDNFSNEYMVDILDTIGLFPKIDDFEGYDVIIHVAGIAHIKETNKNKDLYYKVNRDLAIEVAKTAKNAGIKQFIIFSTMSVYGLSTGFITKSTIENPQNAYGDSKLQADIFLKGLEDENFIVAIVRPPMIYGKGCKGNYQKMRMFALKTFIFPNIKNQRSMLYIGNLTCFVKELIDCNRGGLFFPQNEEYVSTSKIVELIASNNNKKIKMTKVFNFFIKKLNIKVLNKVFGNLTYEKTETINKYSLSESIELSEGEY